MSGIPPSSGLNAAAFAGMTERQRDRMLRILQETRRLLAERGGDGFTMKDVATASGVAEATLYNRFGTKDALLAVVVADSFDSLVSLRIAPFGGKAPLDRVILCAEVVAQSVLENRAFAHALVDAYYRLGAGQAMQLQLADRIGGSWMPLLEEMRRARALRPWVSLPLLGRELCDREFSVVARWAQGQIPEEELRERLAASLLGPLLAASRGRQQADAEQRLAALIRKFDGVDESLPRRRTSKG